MGFLQPTIQYNTKILSTDSSIEEFKLIFIYYLYYLKRPQPRESTSPDFPTVSIAVLLPSWHLSPLHRTSLAASSSGHAPCLHRASPAAPAPCWRFVIRPCTLADELAPMVRLKRRARTAASPPACSNRATSTASSHQRSLRATHPRSVASGARVGHRARHRPTPDRLREAPLTAAARGPVHTRTQRTGGQVRPWPLQHEQGPRNTCRHLPSRSASPGRRLCATACRRPSYTRRATPPPPPCLPLPASPLESNWSKSNDSMCFWVRAGDRRFVTLGGALGGISIYFQYEFVDL